MNWTDEALAALPVKQGVRLRGLEMTRLETFCDAAFAFAVTLLVIAGASAWRTAQPPSSAWAWSS